MRRIKKENEPDFFAQYKLDFEASFGRKPSYAEFRSSGHYHDLKVHIMEEQFGLCCYCMKEIADYNSHIEHFKPQSHTRLSCPNEDVSYWNMLVSCNGLKEKRENCGHKKSDWYSEYYTVSPLECEL